MCYYGAGIFGLITAVLIGLTLTEPERRIIGEEKQSDGKKEPLWKILFQPRMILLVIASSIRNSGTYSII